MSRKHYTEAARIIREADYLTPEARARLVADLITMFADDNPRFVPSRFRAACEPTEEPIAYVLDSGRFHDLIVRGQPIARYPGGDDTRAEQAAQLVREHGRIRYGLLPEPLRWLDADAA